MPIEEVKMFKTSDGQTFDYELEAVVHENEISIKGKLKEFAGKYYYNSMTENDFVDILCENQDELIKIFKGK